MSLTLVNMFALALFVPTTYSYEILGLHESYMGNMSALALFCPRYLQL